MHALHTLQLYPAFHKTCASSVNSCAPFSYRTNSTWLVKYLCKVCMITMALCGWGFSHSRLSILWPLILNVACLSYRCKGASLTPLLILHLFCDMCMSDIVEVCMCVCKCVFSMPVIVLKVLGRCMSLCMCVFACACVCFRPHCVEVEQRLCVYVSVVWWSGVASVHFGLDLII